MEYSGWLPGRELLNMILPQINSPMSPYKTTSRIFTFSALWKTAKEIYGSVPSGQAHTGMMEKTSRISAARTVWQTTACNVCLKMITEIFYSVPMEGSVVMTDVLLRALPLPTDFATMRY